MCLINRCATWFFGRAMLVLVSLCLGQVAMAQQAGPVSPSVVLVLKLVSSTHVKPTTGIVVSDDGLVLVTAEFATGEGEMIVLDGGTDILSNGRPAKMVDQAVASDLALLSVKGLKRPGITLSGNALDTANKLHLEAFPPAEYIAKGSPPLWTPVDVVTGQPAMQPAISPETPLPYVSGAIIDACGYLAGVSLSSGPQSLDTDKPVSTLFTDALRRVLAEIEISTPVTECDPPTQQAEMPAIEEDEPEEPAGISEEQELAQETLVIDPVVTGGPEADVSEPTEVSSQEDVVEAGPQQSADSGESTSVWKKIPLWLSLFGIIILAVFIWKGLLFFRLNKNKPAHQAVVNDVQPASDEPETAPLETDADTDADTDVIKPRSAPVIDFEIPPLSERPEGCDGVLLVEGLLEADQGFKRFCFINTRQFNITIGRGDADISIEHATISRAHARVESAGDALTLSDLGSRNGTFIDDVPCLPGEVFYLEVDEKIFLGDVSLTIRVVKQEAEWA